MSASSTRGRRAPSKLILSLALGAGLLAAGSARAANLNLNVPQFLQEQSQWCTMTSDQMVMSFFGVNIAQCEAANRDYNRNDCCTSPLPAACNPSTGASTSPPLSYYGMSFAGTSDNSYAKFVSEINAFRPVIIGWKWNANPNTGHVFVGRGFDNNSTQWMLINDPAAAICGSPGVSSCWMTYQQFFGGASPTFDHTAQGFTVNLGSSPMCSSDYVDIGIGSTQQCYDQWTHRGRQPMTASTTSSGGTNLYSGSFQPANGSGYGQNMGQSAATYQANFNYYATYGWRPDQVSIANGLVTNLWKPSEGAFASYTGMTAANLASQHSSLTSQGYVMMDFSVNAGPSWNATWVKTTGPGRTYDTGLTQAQFGTKFNSQAAAGNRPARVSAYLSGSTVLYSVLWQQNAAGHGFASYVNMSRSAFISQNASLVSQGYVLAHESALNDVYSGVWTH